MLLQKLDDLLAYKCGYPELRHTFQIIATQKCIQEYVLRELATFSAHVKDKITSLETKVEADIDYFFANWSKGLQYNEALKRTVCTVEAGNLSEALKNTLGKITDCLQSQNVSELHLKLHVLQDADPILTRLHKLQAVIRNSLYDLKYQSRFQKWGKELECKLLVLVPADETSENTMIRTILFSAKQKYGNNVYNRTMLELQIEYGDTAFPSWITHFRGNGCEPIRPELFAHLKLFNMTECFCYLELCGYDTETTSHFSCEQLLYLDVFSSVFRYDICFDCPFGFFTDANIPVDSVTYCIESKCAEFASQGENLCYSCIIKLF